MRVVVESSRAQAQAGEGGGMAVVELAEAEVRERIQIWSGEVFVAGSNSPTSTILSGDAARLQYIVTTWKEEGLMCSLIDVDVAAHSPRMDLAIRKAKSIVEWSTPVTDCYPVRFFRHRRLPSRPGDGAGALGTTPSSTGALYSGH